MSSGEVDEMMQQEGGMLSQEHDSSSTFRRWREELLGKLTANIPGRSHRKKYLGQRGSGQVRPWCFGYPRREGAQVPVDGAVPIPSIPQHALDLSLCFSSPCFFLPTALLRTRLGAPDLWP